MEEGPIALRKLRVLQDSEAAAYESRVLSSDVWDITSAALRVTNKSLGKGSFGEVYLGELGGSLKVAVKTLNRGNVVRQKAGEHSKNKVAYRK